MEYYGQYGEDAVAHSLFKHQPRGVFVDIGSHEGIRFSNSLLFEKLGWKCILVEAHPDYYKLCVQNRPKSTVLHYACGDHDASGCEFFANFRGSLSTLNPNLDKVFHNDYAGYYAGNHINGNVAGMVNGKISVPMITLNTLLQHCGVAESEIDIISIDTDGSEKWVLDGFDIERWKPRIVIVEISVVPDVVQTFFDRTTYHKAFDNGTNAFYCRNVDDCERLKDAKITGKQVKVLHPLDAR